MQAYSDPSRESDPLADGFGADRNLCLNCAREQYGKGWYWWSCFPGCLPDSDANGPFETQAEALEDARNS